MSKTKESTDLLRGMHEIINTQNVKSGINYEELEQALINDGIIVEEADVTDSFNKQLKDLAKSLNVAFDTPIRSASIQSSKAFSSEKYLGSSRGKSYTPNNHLSSKSNLPMGSSILLNSGKFNNNLSRTPYNESNDEESDEESDDESVSGSATNNKDFTKGSPSAKQYNSTPVSDDDDLDDRQSEKKTNNDFPNFDYSKHRNSSSRTEFEKRTEEERMHNQVRGVMNEMGGSSNGIVSLEHAKKEDEKISMLEEIDSLRSGLEEEGAQGLDKIPRITERDPYDIVENVLKRLRLKNDRARYNSLADEFILWGANGLEELFNGERLWFGKYKPNLTGWHKEVQVKLRRMKHDTSTLVSGMMHDFNVGPGMRVALELIPNCFMYARRKKLNYGKPDLFESEDIGSSIDSLRNL